VSQLKETVQVMKEVAKKITAIWAHSIIHQTLTLYFHRVEVLQL